MSQVTDSQVRKDSLMYAIRYRCGGPLLFGFALAGRLCEPECLASYRERRGAKFGVVQITQKMEIPASPAEARVVQTYARARNQQAGMKSGRLRELLNKISPPRKSRLTRFS